MAQSAHNSKESKIGPAAPLNETWAGDLLIIVPSLGVGGGLTEVLLLSGSGRLP